MGLENLVFKNFILENLKNSHILRVKRNKRFGVVYYVTFNPLISESLDDTEYFIKGKLPPKQTILHVSELGDLEKYPLIRLAKKLITDIKLNYNISLLILENPARKGTEHCFGNVRFISHDKALSYKKEKTFMIFAPLDQLTSALADDNTLKTYNGVGFKNSILKEFGIHKLPKGRTNQIVFYKDGRVRF